MKLRGFIIPCLLFFAFAVSAQNITRFEYFFDTDPGYGLGDIVNITPTTTVTDLFIPVSTSSLSPGFHTLHIRAQNASNQWTHTYIRNFYLVAATTSTINMDEMEYFFDTDPGVGLATQVTGLTPSTVLTNIPIDISTTSLSPGFHQIYVRGKTTSGEWTHTHARSFYIANVGVGENIVKFEYFFDTDPGFDNGTSAAVAPPSPVVTNQDIFADVSSLSIGTHTIYVRAKDSGGEWTQVMTGSFLVTAALPPTITSFTPSSGLIGTTVTITGTNFDPVPANNTVQFNGALATATASTSTSITTTVPAGATTGPITVTVLGNTATSASNFIVCPAAPTSVPNQGCENTSITIGASGGSNGQYKWYTVASGGTALAGEVNGSYTTPVLTTTTTYYATITVGGCESDRTQVIATVINTPPPTVTGASACPASTFTLTASGGTNGQYRWYTSPTGGTAITGAINSTYTTPALSITTTYYVSIVNGVCESTRTPATATTLTTGCEPVITPQPLATQVEGKIVIDLVPLISTPGTLDVSSIKIVTPPSSGALATVVSGVLTIDYAGRLFSGTESIVIEACNTNSLCSQQNFSIEVAGEIIVFNAFSPNGDDKNTIFFIQYIDVIPEARNNQVTIYNRWGDEVFAVKDYNNQDRVFTGLSSSGDKLPGGTYFYKIVFGSNKPTVTGFLELRY
jgi:gliding motility-associated-like protein